MIVFLLGGALMLGVSIFLHELGHFLMGRLVGVRAQIFSIGYGKGIWKRQIGDTTWQITAIPFGGYVKFYGDDFMNPGEVPGGFFSVPPLRRMVPVLGGPLFNLILGFFLFLLLHFISGPVAPRVAMWEETMASSPAYLAGLRDGDRIIEVNGKPTKDFYDMKQIVALSGGAAVHFLVEREGKRLEFTVHPEVSSSGIATAGLRPPGERFLEVNYPTDMLWSYRFATIFESHPPIPQGLMALPYLHEDDVILEVDGVAPHSIVDLQQILGAHHGEVVTVKVRRETMPWLTPWFTREVTLSVPSHGEYMVHLKGLVDEKYGESLPDQLLLSSVTDHLRSLGDIRVNGEIAGSFQRLDHLYGKPSDVELEIRGKKYRGNISVDKIGVLGFQAMNHFQVDFLPRHDNVLDVFHSAGEDTWNNIMLYPAFFKRLFSGRMSFMDNARGPVGMFAMAGVIFKSGIIQDYLQLFAAISIALMVMNLLPFPVVDGGHLVFFLYEAVAGKPVPPAVMEAIYKFGLSTLVLLGLWIMYRDVIMVLGM